MASHHAAGSVWLRFSGRFGPGSDVDILVEFQADHVPGFNFVSIEREFCGLLHGRRVDMVTPKFLNPRIRDQVE